MDRSERGNERGIGAREENEEWIGAREEEEEEEDEGSELGRETRDG